MATSGAPRLGRPVPLCKWSLRFLDTGQERGYLASQRDARLRAGRLCLASQTVLFAAGPLVLYLMTAGLSETPTEVAHSLTLVRFWLLCSLSALSALMLGSISFNTTVRHFSDSALEWMAVILILLGVGGLVTTDNHYHARLRGYDPREVWGLQTPTSESFVLLSIDGFVTASHILLDTRWCRLVYIEIFGVLLYLAVSIGLGTPSGEHMLTNALLLFGITAITSLGKRRSEVQDRTAFFEIVGERSLRCEAEFALERKLEKTTVTHEREAQSETSLPTTTMTGRVFEDLGAIDPADATGKALRDLIELGRSEHWLLNPQHLKIRPEEVLGQGGYGIIMAGTLCGAEVAVKFSRERHKLRGNIGTLGHELRILRQLRHPNIILTCGAALDAKCPRLGLVLEKLQGKSLADFVEGTRISSSDLLLGLITVGQISRDVCKALWYLHTRTPSIVHGDLKDGNVFVQQCLVGVSAKLLDFGLARLLGHRRQPLGGTIRWAPPELLGPGYHPSASADIYTLGHLVFFTATRTRPFETYSRYDVIRMLKRKQICKFDWRSACLHKELYQPLVESCTSIEPSGRPAAHEVFNEIERWDEAEPATSNSTPSFGIEAHSERDFASAEDPTICLSAMSAAPGLSL